MFDEKRFGYVTVLIDKKDYARETLEEDLVNWIRNLFKNEMRNDNFIEYKGLLPIREIRHLMELMAVSPYGNGYDVKIDGMNIYDPRLHRRLVTNW